jgi:zinc protease
MRKPGRLLLGLAGLALVALLAGPRGASAQAAAARAAAPAVELPNLAIETHTLPNGLRIVTLEDHSVPVINLQVWYHVGSKDEKPGHTGFAHLFEHLMFKGSAHVGPEEHSRIIEAMGGFDNAYTNDDTTVFWETFPSRYLAKVLWLEADRMGSLNVNEANFLSEREVVKEERRLRVDNQPYGRVIEDLYAAAFTVHPYHHMTLGSMADLDKATLEDVRQFYRTYYRPNNATLVVVGDFSTPQALAWAKEYFDGIPASPGPIPRVAVKEPPQTTERTLEKSYSNSPLPAVIEGYKMPARYAPNAYPLELLSNILAAGESSLLYRTLVYDQRIAIEVFGEGNFTEDPNLFFSGAIMNQGKSALEGEKAIDAVLDRVKQQVDLKELEKAKNQEISQFILGRETDQEKASAIGEAAVIGKDPNRVNTELRLYLKLTAADLERAAKEYFVQQHSTVLLVNPPAAPAP